MKWALLRGLDSPLGTADWVGRNPLILFKKPDCEGGGRFNIDFPGVAIVLAELEGTGEDAVVAIVSKS